MLILFILVKILKLFPGACDIHVIFDSSAFFFLVKQFEPRLPA